MFWELIFLILTVWAMVIAAIARQIHERIRRAEDGLD